MPEHAKRLGVRWQAQRDTAFGRESPQGKAPSPLRSAGALQTLAARGCRRETAADFPLAPRATLSQPRSDERSHAGSLMTHGPQVPLSFGAGFRGLGPGESLKSLANAGQVAILMTVTSFSGSRAVTSNLGDTGFHSVRHGQENL